VRRNNKIENNQPRRILHPSGTVELDNGLGSIPVYHYHLTDHLGNVRAVITPGSNNEAIVVQANDYYPFGMVHSTAPATNLYLYNGKEAQKEMNGRWYDYGARFYDAQLGRWHVVDPLAERHFDITSYNYALNNPLRYIDPLGMDTVDVNNNQPIKKDDVVITEIGTITVNSDEYELKDKASQKGGYQFVTEKDVGTNNDSRKGDGSDRNVDGLLPTVGVFRTNKLMSFIRDALSIFGGISNANDRCKHEAKDSQITIDANNKTDEAESKPVVDSSRRVTIRYKVRGFDGSSSGDATRITTLKDSVRTRKKLESDKNNHTFK
jgi:RHS repeat-associated protein